MIASGRRMLAVVILGVGAVGVAGVYVHSAFAGSPSAPVLPPAKQRIVDAEASAMAHAWRAPKPTDPAAAAPARTPLPPRTPGIVLMHQGPFPGGEFAVRNFWSGPVAGRWLLVYAGGPRSMGGQVTGGALRLFSQPLDPNVGNDMTPVGEFLLPTARSALTILSVQGEVMTLQTDTGRVVRFDLATSSFG